MFKYLILDLDNTLYPKQSGMLQKIDQRIDNFINRTLNMPKQEVTTLRNKYWQKFGTTLGGLIINHRINPEEYMRYAYQIEPKDYIQENPILFNILNEIDLIKIIYSNSPREYIERVVEVLGISKLVDKIYDIRFSDFMGKPNLSSYLKVLQDLNTGGENCIMVDDTLVNLCSAKQMNIESILISNEEVKNVDWIIHEITELKLVIPKIIAGRRSA